MKKFSKPALAATIRAQRDALNITQVQLSEITGINRTMIGRIEREDYIPTIPQLEKLAEVLQFDPLLLFMSGNANDPNAPFNPNDPNSPFTPNDPNAPFNPADPNSPFNPTDPNAPFDPINNTGKGAIKPMKITVAGVGYVGLSLAVLLSQNNEVKAITTTKAKEDQLNRFYSPIQDDEIERFFAEARDGRRKLNLTTTTDKEAAYKFGEIVVIATPTNYDDAGQFFDTSAVEDAIECTLKYNPDALMVIKSTIPVGYTEQIRAKYGIKNIIFSPEFLRESKALYDNLHPSRIVVGCDDDQKELAQNFAQLLKDGAISGAGNEAELAAANNIPILITHPT